jgi:hypothetical protein
MRKPTRRSVPESRRLKLGRVIERTVLGVAMQTILVVVEWQVRRRTARAQPDRPTTESEPSSS